MSNPETLLLVASFFVIAALYSSIGFGGGSSYLALLALFIPDFFEIKTTALLCNITVVAGSSILYMREGYFKPKKFLPLVVCSMPAAFLGATVNLKQDVFFGFLGAALVLSGLLLIGQYFLRSADTRRSFSQSLAFNAVAGTGVGFLSGVVGIGGGIFLSPILNLLRWDNAKVIAALASFFILVNSASGLLGQVYSGTFKVDFSLLALLLIAVFVGGQLGSRWSLQKVKPEVIKTLTGCLVCYVGLRLVLSYTFGISI